MSQPPGKKGFELLYDEVLRQKKLDESLVAIARIVSEHPEWVQQVPELEEHLKNVSSEFSKENPQ